MLVKLILLPIWVKVILAKYIFAWLVAEGVCVISGLSFVERKENGFIDWKGCANVKVGRLETAVCFGNVIEAFNINTNHWVAVYVYKRLKFMGNQILSQVVTLFFLAVWHGFHFGYYLTFFNEFMTIKVEREFLSMWNKSEVVQGWRQHPAFAMTTNVIGWVWVVGLLPHNFLPFSLLLWNPTFFAYRHTYFVMYILYLVWWMGLRGLIKNHLGGVRKEKVEDRAVLVEPKQVESEEKVQEEKCETVKEEINQYEEYESTIKDDIKNKIEEIDVTLKEIDAKIDESPKMGTENI